MNESRIRCIDCGTENCPCYLALTGDCLMCTRLQGRNYCDCDYTGVCVYNEFIQGNKTVNNPRALFPAKVEEMREFYRDITVFSLRVSKGFAMKCEIPGSYIFMKAKYMENFYQIPISVMKAEPKKEMIYVAVQKASAKSKSLLACDGELLLRGVYRNGILGIKKILDGRGEPIAILAKGIGVAPMALLLNSLSCKIKVDIYLDMDKISEELLFEYLPKRYKNNIRIVKIDDFLLEKQSVSDFFEGQKKRLVLASDYYIHEIRKKIHIDGYSNNYKLCCGEGICGSCGINLDGNNVFKMCKCNDPVQI